MNPAAAAAALAPPPQPPQPHRPSKSCNAHPDESFTGFCPSCLYERLSVLEHDSSTNNSNNPSASVRKPPISAATLKAIFKPSSALKTGNGASSSNFEGGSGNNQARQGFFPELRRTKSFSASKNEGFSGVFEPQRRSCDVRVRNTLWSLFNEDDERNPNKKGNRAGCGVGEIEVEARQSSVRDPVFESKEEEKSESEGEEHVDGGDFEIVRNTCNEVEDRVQEIVEEEEEREEIIREEEQKPMKNHMDADSSTKKPSGRDLKDIAGSFWSAASVFSKKLQKWRQKQKMKKRRNAALPVEKPIGRQYRETQSEIADYGFGRRSCDTDPRFSLDAGRFSLDTGRVSIDAGRFSVDAARFSVDDPRYSFEEPRASWDGYLIGRTLPARMPMLSVVEDAPVSHRHVSRSDAQIPVEQSSSMNDDAVPGGSAQTRDYYLDSSTSRRRKSIDRSSSIRKTAASVVAEMDELKSVSNAKVSPGLVIQDKNFIDSNSNPSSLQDDCSVENLDTSVKENAGNNEKKGTKKSRRWSWNIWGLIHRRSSNKDEEDERFSRASGVDRSFSESWQDMRSGAFNPPRLARSNSSVSWRSSNGFGGGAWTRNNHGDTNGGKRVREGFGLERNRSTRYSPGKVDNGLLRFYLTPLRGSRRGGWGKSRPNPAHSIARSVLRMY